MKIIFYLLFIYIFLIGNAQSIETSTVVIENENSSNISIIAEVMTTETQQARGMMYRKSLDRDKGMLFLFKEPKKAVFWMKNTYVSLDLIFIREGGFIDSIHENLDALCPKIRKSQQEVIAVIVSLWG